MSILKKQSVKTLIIFLAGFLIAGCQTVENRYSPQAEKESITHKDPIIRFRKDYWSWVRRDIRLLPLTVPPMALI